MTNSVIIATKPPKKRKVPHLSVHSRVRKTWPMRKVKLQAGGKGKGARADSRCGTRQLAQD
jgi:hypothetical protein